MSNRVMLASGIVSVLAIAAALQSYNLSAQQAPDPYKVTAGQARFAAALEILPASGVIGYLSDMQVGGANGAIAYMSAQYAMAPRAIVPAEKSHPEWALGNFARPGNFAERGAQTGYRIVRDLGNGVVIYRRTQP
jgi:hypothetical protein